MRTTIGEMSILILILGVISGVAFSAHRRWQSTPSAPATRIESPSTRAECARLDGGWRDNAPAMYACCDKKNDNLLYATHNGITVVVDGCKEAK